MWNDTTSMRCYVSYAWADEGDPHREAQVDALIEQARKKGIDVVRDKDALKAGDRISDFMRQIGGGDRVFVFLSRKYLTSPFCMNELFLMWRNSRQDDSDFLRRVRLYKLDDVRFDRFEDRLEYAKYWRNEHDRLEGLIKGSLSEVSDFDYSRFRLMNQFATNIGDILALFSDTVRPRSFEEFLKYGFEDASLTDPQPPARPAPSAPSPPAGKGAADRPPPVAAGGLPSRLPEARESAAPTPPARALASRWPMALAALLVLALGAGVWRYLASRDGDSGNGPGALAPKLSIAWCYQEHQKSGLYFVACHKLQADCAKARGDNNPVPGTGCEPVDLSKAQWSPAEGGLLGSRYQTASAPFPKPFPQIAEAQPPPPRTASGYGIVFGGDSSIPAALDEVSKVTKPPISAKAIIFFRQQSYRSVAYFDTAEDAAAALSKIKAIRSDAYQVALSAWCPRYTVDAAATTPVEVRTCVN